MRRPVLTLPEAVLKRPAQPIEAVDEAALALATDLVDTMRASPACVGLAAPQIGVGVRAFAVDVTGHRKAHSCHGLFVLFNPEILLARATKVVVRGLTPEGNDRVLEVDAFEARAVLHEMDHLDGLLFLDRVTGHDAVFRRKVYR